MLQNISAMTPDVYQTSGNPISHETVINQIKSFFDRLKKANDPDLISEIAKKIYSIHLPTMCTNFIPCITSVFDDTQLLEELRQAIEVLASQLDQYVAAGKSSDELDQRRREIQQDLKKLAHTLNDWLAEQKEQKQGEIREKVANLMKSVNDNLKTNYLLRGWIREDIEKLTEENFSNWVTTHDWEELKKYTMPPSVSNAFKVLKETIIKSAMDNFKESYHRISEKKEIISTLDHPSDEFLEVLGCIFEDPQVTMLEEETLQYKMETICELLRANPLGLSGLMIKNKLVLLFGESFAKKKIHDIARYLIEYNPYKKTLIERLLSDHAALKGKIICFVQENIIQSTKIVNITRDPHRITINGQDNCCVTLSFDKIEKHIEKIVWKQKISESLDQFLLSDGLMSKGKKCRVYANPEMDVPERFMEMKNLLNGMYTITLEYCEEERMFSSVRGKSYYKEFIFTPIEKKRKPESIHDSTNIYLDNSPLITDNIVIRIDDDNQDRWIFMEGEKKKSVSGQWSDFSKFFMTETCETNVRVFDQIFRDNRVYITQTEPVNRKSIQELLKKEMQIKQALIKSLKDNSFVDLFQCLVNRKDASNLLKKIIDENETIKKQLLTLCNLKEINSQKAKEELLLSFIHKVNFLQLRQNNKGAETYVMDDYLHLIDMLGRALKTSETLKGKRGILFIGSTGSGKSTSVSYFIGVPLQTMDNRFGETYVLEAESAAQGSGPKIGHALGVSETLLTNPCELLNTSASATSSRRQPKLNEIRFPPGTEVKDFRLIDTPGFHDTRGTDYEIATNFSIDHSVQSIDEIDAIVQVIDYSVFLPHRSNLFLKELEELCKRFPDVLKNSDLREKVFFIITKQGDRSEEQLKERVSQLLKEENDKREDQKNSYYSKETDKSELLQFFLEQIVIYKNVELLSPCSDNQRIDFLNKVLRASEKSEESLKSKYQMSLSQPSLILKFSHTVHGAICQWDVAFKAFLNLAKDIKSKENDILSIDHELKRKTELLTDRNQKLRELEKLIPICKNILNQSLQNVDSLDGSLQEKIQHAQKERTLQIRLTIDHLKQEIDVLNSLIEQKKIESDEASELERSYEATICQINIDLNNYSSGVSPQILENRSFKKSTIIKGTNWQLSSEQLREKSRRAVERGDEYFSGHEDASNYTNETHHMEETFSLYPNISVNKDYQLVPSVANDREQLRKLNLIRDGDGSVTFDHDGYSISIEKNKVEFIDIKPHNDGKKIAYGYKMNFDGKKPYPKLVITHTIPTQELYKTQIAAWRDQKSTLEGTSQAERDKKLRAIAALEQHEIEKKVKENQLEDNNDILKVEELEVGVDIVSGLIQGYEVDKDNLEKELKQLHQEMTSLTIQNNERKAEKKILSFHRQRWALFIETHGSQLDQAVKIAEFFTQNQANYKTDLRS
ncbi:MAG: hypothetical protein H0T62_10810, partial [Parachlamydiaceae bacterium]|nr:hypothetical protein [Parachlamydiaceae bacterium]